MSNMEFLKQNFLTDTSMFKTDSGSGTLQYLYDRNIRLGYVSLGYPDTSVTTLSIEFEVPTVISNIVLQHHNLKKFKAYYDSSTSNTFSFDISVSCNSTTNHYFSFASVTVSSIQLQLEQSMTPVEKEIGELIITERKAKFDRNPSADNFEPVITKTRIKHRMPDGGVTTFEIAQKYKARFKFKFHDESFRDTLEQIYYEGLPMYFIPFPTSTSWDGRAYEVLWTDDFDFRHSDNSKTQGYDGQITIEETAGA
jgi:hypothetical protein